MTAQACGPAWAQLRPSCPRSAPRPRPLRAASVGSVRDPLRTALRPSAGAFLSTPGGAHGQRLHTHTHPRPTASRAASRTELQVWAHEAAQRWAGEPLREGPAPRAHCTWHVHSRGSWAPWGGGRGAPVPPHGPPPKDRGRRCLGDSREWTGKVAGRGKRDGPRPGRTSEGRRPSLLAMATTGAPGGQPEALT